MKRLLALLIPAFIMACGASSNVAAARPAVYVVDPAASSGVIGFEVTNVEYRNDLTRIYGRIIGRPHTSGRIDEMVLTGSDGKKYQWTDIDGVDAKRYFQWEDTPYIIIEIDFPPMKPQGKMTIDLTGPKGSSVWTIIKSSK